ncbi:MAG: restriction endonuclease subunit S [Cyclobacteriaceae bacterium]|nr:restriction endonuclease subunit S [Cyclobacteriaceae bacterium]
MSQANEMQSLLKAMGFVLEDGASSIWSKGYANHNNYKIRVDLEGTSIDFGKYIKKSNKVVERLKNAESLVVLECVNRLLEKGYKPQTIELEKTWPTGHGTSGRLDILVTREDGTTYLMIECKTFGFEFDKECKRIKKDGGQLFTYFQQDKDAEILMLYTSRVDKAKVEYKNEIIKIEEDYRQTGNVRDFYDRWNKLPKNNGVFDSWVKAYDFQSKALTPKNLSEIKQEDSSFIFNQFLEILRHNVVSDKPNAFNKIFTLFLCKIYDEKVTRQNDELAFQWFYSPYRYEGIDYPPDDNVSFQKRLTDLYRKGMKEFLDKDVTDISDAEFEKKYGKLDTDTKKKILNEFTEIRLKKNNEFAIKEVFNDASFEENAKVVKEVVELIQGYKIRYTKKQQYLSDFFELLLTTGLKQESGQFFTPVPIAQFIIKSIPLDKIVHDKLNAGEKDNLLPTIIDYAAGSGHFITESMHEVQRIIDTIDPSDYIDGTAKKIASWKTDHFDWAYQYIYGIEKDYRLVKVGKVGCYLHGDGLAQIVHSDGLGNFKKTEEYKGLLRKTDKDFAKENKQFDIVVSNPPYSVAAFRNNARKFYTESDFDLYEKLTDQSSEIECLFIERTKQLLKDGGIAGIILPSSILSNTGIYTSAREIILRHFDIVAIAELGGSTFMATSTTTVTLFLRRRNNYDTNNIHVLVKKSLSESKDFAINNIDKPLSKYVNHVWEGLSVKDYLTLLQRKPNDTVKQHDIFVEYKKKIKSKREEDFWISVIELEEDKFFYFVLCYSQKIVIVKSLDDKQFLGYEFSNRRGNEGIHPTQKGKSIDDCTMLFDSNVFDNPTKASTYVYKAFQGDFDFEIDRELESHVFRADLKDLISFNRSDFEKSISLEVKKKVLYESIWGTQPLFPLRDIAEVRKGTSITKDKTTPGKIPVVAGGQEPAYYHSIANRSKNVITVSASGAYAGFVNYFDREIFASDCNTIISKNEDTISTSLIYAFLKRLQPHLYGLQRGQAQPHVYKDDLEEIKIPIPSPTAQRKILGDLKKVESKEAEFKNKITDLQNQIYDLFLLQNSKGVLKKLEEICDLRAGKFKSPKEIFPNDGDGLFPCYGGNGLRGYTRTTTHVGRFPLVGRQGALCGNVHLVDGQFHATEHALVATPLKEIDVNWLFYLLKTMNLNRYATGTAQPGLSVKNINPLQVNVLPIKEQEKLLVRIEELEMKIKATEHALLNIDGEKHQILEKYFKTDD